MQDKCLIIGASGQIGQAMKCSSEDVRTQFSVRKTGMLRMDLGDHDQLFLNIKAINPKRIIILGGNTDVEYCESHPEETYKVNVESMRHIVKAAPNSHITFVSSDYIFGEGGPHAETASPNPLNEYGRQKMIAEHILSTQHDKWLIIRTSSVFGPTSENNFGRRVFRRLLNGDTVIAGEEFCNPTYAPFLAEKIYKKSCIEDRGVSHICGNDNVSRFTFAQMIANSLILSQDKIRKIDKDTRLARRPMSGGLLTTVSSSMLAVCIGLMIRTIERENKCEE